MRTGYVHIGGEYQLTNRLRFGVHAGAVGKVVALVQRRNGIAYVWECRHEHHVVVRSRDLHDVEDAPLQADWREGCPVSDPPEVGGPPLTRSRLRLLRWARTGLVLVAGGAVVAFLLAASHGFRPDWEICYSQQDTCGNNPTWNARTVAWLAPLVFTGAVIALSVLSWLLRRLVTQQLQWERAREAKVKHSAWLALSEQQRRFVAAPPPVVPPDDGRDLGGQG